MLLEIVKVSPAQMLVLGVAMLTCAKPGLFTVMVRVLLCAEDAVWQAALVNTTQ